MLAARSRSRSQTVDTAPSRGTDTSAVLNSDSRLSPAPTSSAPTPTSPHTRNHKSQQEMISTVTQQSSAMALENPMQIDNSATQQALLQDDDDRSSSLSELDEGADDQLGAASIEPLPDHELDYDTEAETERLERTPQKLNAPLNSFLLPEKSPSKLAQEVSADDSTTPTANGHDIIGDLQDDTSPSKTLFESNGAGLDGEESPSRKRKRSESAVSSLSDTDEPLAKRSHSARYQGASTASSTETLTNKPAPVDREEGAGDQEVEEHITTERDQGGEVLEPSLPLKGRKGRKGKRKGRRAANDDPEGNAEDPLAQDEQDAADEEEEDSNRDEEIAKKRLALDAFSKIEREFTAFREKHIKQQLQLISSELDLLREPSSTHPEYLAQLKCVDDYRDEKIRHQDVLFKFKHGALQVRTVAERQQLHSQYFQEVRDMREKTLEECYKNLYAIQKDRRRWGADEANYAHLYQPKRAEQISQQSSYNLEVSILSGVAKHVGFPAAPILPTLQTDDVDSDFKFMKIPDRPVQPRISLRDAEREAAEKSFFEQNPWANPSIAHAMVQAQAFATPAGQNRIVSNGSTIDVSMMSAPNSQHPTPQNSLALEAALGGLAKLHPQVESSPAAASVGPIPSVLSATTFPTSGLHGTEAKDTPPAPLPVMSISVGGGGNRFGQ